MEADVIDTLAGIAPGSHLDSVRRTRRAVAREHAQKSYDFAVRAGRLLAASSPLERYAVAVFVAGLHGQAAIKEFYAAKLRSAAATDATRAAIDAEIAAAATKGPYGAYPKGPLSKEDTSGPVHRVADAHREALGPRLVGGLRARAHAGLPSARCRCRRRCRRCSMPAGRPTPS